jgi:hypothetical protein
MPYLGEPAAVQLVLVPRSVIPTALHKSLPSRGRLGAPRARSRYGAADSGNPGASFGLGHGASMDRRNAAQRSGRARRRVLPATAEPRPMLVHSARYVHHVFGKKGATRHLGARSHGAAFQAPIARGQLQAYSRLPSLCDWPDTTGQHP